MAAGKSLKPFYAGMGVIALAGVALIARGTLTKSAPPLSLDSVGPLASGPRGVVLGSDSAPIEIMEFSDFECPYCARFATLSMPDIKARLIDAGRVRWRFVHYPLQGHLKSPSAHLAAACANEQGRFWPMHDLIYQFQGDWTEARDIAGALATLADRAGLDRDRYDRCFEERAAWGRVLADKALGDSLGINGTPTFYVNGRVWESRSYSADAMRAMVDSVAPQAPAAPR